MTNDDVFICYHCTEGDCANCVGVPCMCDCPDPRHAGEQKCCVKDCERRGTPQQGFDFFVCTECLDTLAVLLRQRGMPA